MRFTSYCLFLLLGGVLLLLGPSTALTQPGGDPSGGGSRGGWGGGKMDPKAWSAMMFNRMANGKDFVTAADLEASAAKYGDTTAREKIQQFLQSQNITNGQVNRDQFAIYMEQRMADRQASKDSRRRGDPSGGGSAPVVDDDKAAVDWFRRQDKNGDGVLQPEEMTPELRAELSKWDTNKNGVIELDEYKEYYKARMAYLRDPTGSNPQGGSGSDPTQTGQLPPAEPVEAQRPVVYHAGNLPKELPAWFAQLDKDKDGQVGLYEWKDAGKPIEEFRAMDINGDGFITVEEALRYQKVMTKGKSGGSSGQPVRVAVLPVGGPVMPAGNSWVQPGAAPVLQGAVQWVQPAAAPSLPAVMQLGQPDSGKHDRHHWDKGGDKGGGKGRSAP